MNLLNIPARRWIHWSSNFFILIVIEVWHWFGFDLKRKRIKLTLADIDHRSITRSITGDARKQIANNPCNLN